MIDDFTWTLPPEERIYPRPEQPARFLFLYRHYASGVYCVQPDYFMDREEAERFYATYTGPHIKRVSLEECKEGWTARDKTFFPYEEPRYEE